LSCAPTHLSLQDVSYKNEIARRERGRRGERERGKDTKKKEWGKMRGEEREIEQGREE
jgi:hypothetical protein